MGAQKTRLSIEMKNIKIAHEVSDGNMDPIGIWTFWKIIWLDFLPCFENLNVITLKNIGLIYLADKDFKAQYPCCDMVILCCFLPGL